MAQEVRRETGALEEGIGERLAAVEDSLDESARESREEDGEFLRMLAALLWFSSFDEHRDEGGQRLMSLLGAAGLDELITCSTEEANSYGE